MPNKIFLDIDETVGPDAIAEMERSMMEASLMYPGVQFELQRGSMQNKGDYRTSMHVDLYPDAGSNVPYGLTGDHESHIVMTRDPMTYGGGLGYRSASGNTRVIKTDLTTLGGLTSDERVTAITRALTNEAGRMYGRQEPLLMRSDLTEEEMEAAWNEIERILEDDAGDPEERQDLIREAINRVVKEPFPSRRKTGKYSVAVVKPAQTQKPAQKKAQKKKQSQKKSQPKNAQPKQPPKKDGEKRRPNSMKIGKVSKLK